MIRHIVVVDSKRGIAKNGDQPIHLKIDGQYFSEKTMLYGGNVLMGRTLFEMIGALKNRQNFVATHRTQTLTDVALVNNLKHFVPNFQADLWIIGGGEIYNNTIDYADELYVTEITTDFSCDTFYPDFSKQFELVSRTDAIHEQNVAYTFCVYKRLASGTIL